jgi:SAM-dependent methyltransferase
MANRVERGTLIDYEPLQGAGERYEQQIISLIKERGANSVCEVGGGAHPLLKPAALAIDYTVLDISRDELAKAPSGYKTVVADITARDFRCEHRFDVVFTKFLAEHVRDGAQFHRNVFSMLKPGGFALHLFPTMYALPFLANRLLPERLGRLALALFSPNRVHGDEGKFPAYYRWCCGPTRGQIQRFRNIGFQVIRYTGYFGHPYYKRIPGLRTMERVKADWLLRNPVAMLASYASVVLHKPEA